MPMSRVWIETKLSIGSGPTKPIFTRVNFADSSGRPLNNKAMPVTAVFCSQGITRMNYFNIVHARSATAMG